MSSVSGGRRLTTWKEIGSYIGRDGRTAKRYEIERGLPVRRMPGQRKSVVFAYSDEIDLWLRALDGSLTSTLSEDVAGDVEAADPSVSLSSQHHSTIGVPLAASLTTDDAASFSHAPQIETAAPDGALSRFRVYLLAALAVLCVAGLYVVSRNLFSPAKSLPATTTTSAQALRDYQFGRYAWNHRNSESLKSAANAFQDALNHDPTFAAAYAGLADCYLLMPEFGGLPAAQAYPRARAAAERALSLNPNLADAHRALGFVSFYWDEDVQRSDREFRTALRLDPSSPQTHHWYANALATRGERSRAQAEIGRARELDPTNTAILSDMGWILMVSGDLAGARAVLSEVEATDPAYASAHRYMGDVDRLSGDDVGMLVEWSRVADLTHDRILRRVVEAGQQALPGGKAAVLRAIVGARERMFATGAVSPFQLAGEEMLAKRPDKALGYLQAAALQRDPAFLALNSAPEFLPLRSDVRFQRLQARASMPAPAGPSP